MNETGAFAPLASLAAPLPDPPEGDILTPEQWETLIAVCEPFVPAISSTPTDHEKLKSYLPGDADTTMLDEYFNDSLTTEPRFRKSLHRMFSFYVPKQGREGLTFILSSLGTRAGALLLTGYATPIAQQPLERRAQITAAWADSYLPLLRTLHRTFAGLAKKIHAQHSTTLPKVLGFPEVPKDIERGDTYKFDFIDFSSSDAKTTLETDVVIIGSGCGAGVMAAKLANAGLKCIVLEKSYHYSAEYFPMAAAEATEHLFESGSHIPSDDSSIIVIAGSTFGGGGTINWSASLQPQSHIRREWAENGLPQFSTEEFQSCLDYVCERMGAAKSSSPEQLAKIPHNFANSTLLEGARRLGLSSIVVPQNTGGKPHWCGYCSNGCSSCTKQGPVNNWLPDAAEHGAQFIEGCFVDKILFSATSPSAVTGVLCTWTSRDRKSTKSITINAPRIVVSAGTLNSPLILTRSGLTNPHIGRNLHLHPCVTMAAHWPNRVNGWEGPILTSAVTALQNYDATGYGPAIECLCATPSFATLFYPYRANLVTKEDPLAAARDMRIQTAKWSHGTAFISLQRDRDGGQVYQDPDNNRLVRIKYTASQRDRNGMLQGQLAAARIAYVMGAEEIDCMNPTIARFNRSKTASKEVNDEAFELWLKDVERNGVASKNWQAAPMGTAHQMGTCRIGASWDKGVCDPWGKVWGCENVWVADASVFPTATGVNPMVTTMGLAEWIGRGIVRGWEEERAKE